MAGLYEEIRLAKRKRMRDYNNCCVVCKLTGGRKKRLEMKEEEEEEEDVKEDDCLGDDVVVDLHTSTIQVLMTVNAPIGLELSLDFLPCFQTPAEDPTKDGWIGAGSSSGLLLCTTGKFNQSQYYVCNPLSRQWVALPPAPRLHTRVHVGFVVEPCGNNCQQPLCSDCRFEVVRFHHEHQCQQMHPRTHYEVETYSSHSGQWTIETVFALQQMRWSPDPADFQSILHNRRLHWLSGSDIVVYDPYEKVLLGVIHPPSRLQACRKFSMEGLSVSDGSLWISQYAGLSLDLRFWQLKGYHMHTRNLDGYYWKPMCKFNVLDLTGGPRWGPKSAGCTVLGMHPRDPNIAYLKLVVSSHLGGQGGFYFVGCNLKTKTLAQPRFLNLQYGRAGNVVVLAFPHPIPSIPSSSDAIGSYDPMVYDCSS